MGGNFGEIGESSSIPQNKIRQNLLFLLQQYVGQALDAKIKFAKMQNLGHSPKFRPSKITRYTVYAHIMTQNITTQVLPVYWYGFLDNTYSTIISVTKSYTIEKIFFMPSFMVINMGIKLAYKSMLLKTI